MTKLMIGWSEADITPDKLGKPIPLNGQYYARNAIGIHSRLKNVVVAISSGREYFITGSIDNVGCPQNFVDAVREAVAELEPAIDPMKIFLNAIHTHTGPSLAVKKKDENVQWAIAFSDTLTPEEYCAFAVPIVAQNIVNAWKNRKEGGIARAFGNARIGHCRRAVFANGSAEMYGDTTRKDFICMEAGEDSGVDMLFTFDADGKRTGMFLNVACPSQVMESAYYVSSDFAGATRELLKKEYGEDFHTIYEISPAGCQSPRDLVRHYATEPDCWHADGVVELSNRLLAAVKNVSPGKIEYEPVLKHKTLRVTLPRRRASYTDYRKALTEIDRLTTIMQEDKAFEAFCAETHANEKKGGPGPYDSKLHHFVLIKNAQAVVKRYEDQDEFPKLIFDMNVIRLGDIAFANNPFELYLYYGQNIKARSHAKQTFLVQLSGGANFPAGYLPSPDAEKFGGYGGLIINGQVGSDGGFMLADITVKEINELFE